MIKLIVGLGNPGDRYAKTRHNAGFWLLDEINSQWRDEKKFYGLYGKGCIANYPLHMLKPQTFMNASGQALSAVCHFFDIAADEVLVVHDELDLPVGTARLKFGGGHGGHNGLRDIIKALDSRDFYRLRIGIGHPGDRQAVVDYVLKAPGKAELADIQHAINRAEKTIPILLSDGVEKAMQQLHTDS